MDCCEEKVRSSPAWGIRLLDHMHRRAGSYAIADIPLQDPAQHMMLVNIDRISMHGTLPSQRELAASMHLSPATVTATLKLLERSGYIRRIADDKDQRINRVALTESGKNIMRDAMHRMDTLDEIMQEGLTNEEQKILCRCLSKMRENLSRYINSREADAHD